MAQVFDTKRRALGKGLESLLPAVRPAPGQSEAPAQTATPGLRPSEIPIELIDPNPRQPRTLFNPERLEELTRSVQASGVVQPIVVRPKPNGRYELIAGERRCLASKAAGKTTIPAVIREVSDLEAMEITIVENLMRADLNPMEQARAFEQLGREFHMTHDEVAARTGKDRASITNFLRLLKLPEEVQAYVERGVLLFGHAKLLLALENGEAIKVAAARVWAEQMSVRQTERYIQELLDPHQKQQKAERTQKPLFPIDPNVREAEDRLRRRLGLKVHIEDRRGRGKVVIEYSGLEDFDAILSALAGTSADGDTA